MSKVKKKVNSRLAGHFTMCYLTKYSYKNCLLIFSRLVAINKYNNVGSMRTMPEGAFALFCFPFTLPER